MAKFFGGLDIGSSVCSFSVIDQQSQLVYSKKFGTSEMNLIEVARDVQHRVKGELHVALEEGEMASWVAGVLRNEVARVVVADPKRNAWIAKDPHKADSVDDQKLARLLKAGELNEVYQPMDQDRAEFKRVVQHYHRMTRVQADLRRQIKARFRRYGVIPRGNGVFNASNRDEALKRIPSPHGKQIIQQLYELLDSALDTQKKAHKLMVAFGRKFPEVARFQQVPGVGPVWSCTFSAYIQTPQRFENKQRLWSYCRLGIGNRSSNDRPLGHAALDNNGVAILKALSYQVFCCCMNSKGRNEFREYFEASLERVKDRTHARLNTQRKILLVLWAMWKRDEEYRPYGREEEEKSNTTRA